MSTYYVICDSEGVPKKVIPANCDEDFQKAKEVARKLFKIEADGLRLNDLPCKEFVYSSVEPGNFAYEVRFIVSTPNRAWQITVYEVQ
jgi:hypothetical protein